MMNLKMQFFALNCFEFDKKNDRYDEQEIQIKDNSMEIVPVSSFLSVE